MKKFARIKFFERLEKKHFTLINDISYFSKKSMSDKSDSEFYKDKIGWLLTKLGLFSFLKILSKQPWTPDN